MPSHSSTTVFFTLMLGIAVRTGSPFNVAQGQTAKTSSSSPSGHMVVGLKDFRDQEVRSAGFTTSKELSIHVSALGGGEKRSFENWFGDDDPQLYARGWIINADTREPVWDMTFGNTSGRDGERRAEEDLTLPRASYEVYFSAFGYQHHDGFSNFSVNIDRRKGHGRHRSFGQAFLSMFGLDADEHYADFMDLAKDWGIWITVAESEAPLVSTFDAPAKNQKSVFAACPLGDNEVIRKTVSTSRDLVLHIRAVGEGRKKDGMFDYGWMIKSDTRERVWEMSVGNTKAAGGAAKNRAFDDDVRLAKGSYELVYVTDGSHSSEDWNANPPYDPFMYGISLSVTRESDRNAVTVSAPPDIDKNIVVKLTKVHNDDFVSAGFSLTSETKLHVYAIGEWDNNDHPADYGWIVDAKTRERVWSMERRHTVHAGGAQKNRMVDEMISLPKGNYIAYYQTDGSHAYNDWNSDPPYDEEHWGLTIAGSGEEFDPKSVTSFNEEDEQNVIAQIIRAHSDSHLSKRFTLKQPTTVTVYSVGEGMDREMYDYGWIEEASSGRVVWEMTYRMTEHAGGAEKNRMVHATITLQPGEYELCYETDGSHAFNDWNDDPPEDRIHWGITLYKEK